MNRRARIVRAVGRFLMRVGERLLTQTTIIGKEHLAASGPVIYAANHASTYDAMLLITHLPPDAELVGPGDFRLLWPASFLVRWAGVIPVNRGKLDRTSLRTMSKVLNSGGQLGLFPEGGTWEKRLDDVKPGAAYLSLSTHAPIVPVALGGTYNVWSRIFRLERPRITFVICPPRPPVESPDSKQRDADLWAASMDLMREIYAHLPEADQARYDLAARQTFSGCFEINPPASGDLPGGTFAVLAELVSKPNLFSPLHRNAKLPLRPFLDRDHFHPASEVLKAAEALKGAFCGDFQDYLPYRLGNEKAQQILTELDALITLARQVEWDARLRFVVQVAIQDRPGNDAD